MPPAQPPSHSITNQQKLAAAGKLIPAGEIGLAGKLAYRVPEACHLLGIGRTSLYELVRDGKLKLVKIAGRTLVPHSELNRLLREALEAAGGPGGMAV
jgi:excisionase family DNA binding protein